MFSTAIAGSNNLDTITDFTMGIDKIVFDHTVFAAVGCHPVRQFAILGTTTHPNLTAQDFPTKTS